MRENSLPADIRLATTHDIPELARLLTALGHPTSVDGIEAHWAEWSASGDSALVADAGDGTLVGVATLHATRVLHRPRPVGRVTALVVDEAVRGQGIGRRLIEAAEEVLQRRGCGLVEITSNVRRVDAHGFYEHLGYERTSVRLAKTLPHPDRS